MCCPFISSWMDPMLRCWHGAHGIKHNLSTDLDLLISGVLPKSALLVRPDWMVEDGIDSCIDWRNPCITTMVVQTTVYLGRCNKCIHLRAQQKKAGTWTGALGPLLIETVAVELICKGWSLPTLLTLHDRSEWSTRVATHFSLAGPSSFLRWRRKSHVVENCSWECHGDGERKGDH